MRDREEFRSFHGTKHCLHHGVHDQQVLNTVGRSRVTTTADPTIDQPVRLIVAIHAAIRDIRRLHISLGIKMGGKVTRGQQAAAHVVCCNVSDRS